MQAPPHPKPALVPAPPDATGLRRYLPALSRQFLIVASVTVFMSMMVSLRVPDPFGRNWAQTQIQWLYCLCITLCCSALIQGLAALYLSLINLLRSRKQLPLQTWPGWFGITACLLLGTLAGLTLGVAIANAWTGHEVRGPLNLELRSATAVWWIALLPGVAVTLYFAGRSKIELARTQAQSAQRAAAEHQLRLLQSQLEPHMLFNTLANLRVLIGMDPQRAQAMLDQLIAFLRATLTASRANTHSLREEFSRLQDYLALMQIRMGARLQPSLDLPADLAELQMPPLLLQALVENAIKHGLEPSIEGGELHISASLQGQGLEARLLLEVWDGGVGMSSSTPSSEGTGFRETAGSGFGVHQVRERLQTQFGNAASFQLGPRMDGKPGTLARIRMPVLTTSSDRPA